MDIFRLMNETGIDDAAKDEVTAMLTDPDAVEILTELKSLFSRDEQAFLDSLRNRQGWKKLALAVYLAIAAEAHDKYVLREIPDRIYFDTMKDIAIWERECFRKYREHGLEEVGWLTRHLRLDLFCLGSLQFEPILTGEELSDGKNTWPSGTLALNVHIPEGADLSPAACRESFRRAERFFGNGPDLYICDSWLLAPELRRFLPDTSNIIRFQDMFTIVRVHHTFAQAEQRIFRDVMADKTKYPEDTSLQRKAKPYFAGGGDPGIGTGVIPKIRCMPFMSELKCVINSVSVLDYSSDPAIMAETEIRVWKEFRPDRIVLGPNTRGISEALGVDFIYPAGGTPYPESPAIRTPEDIPELRLRTADSEYRQYLHDRFALFEEAARIIRKSLPWWVKTEMSIGGPMTIASMLMGTERLLRDCRKDPDAVQLLLRTITDMQKMCIDMASGTGAGIAMADPVANPELIGPRMYEEFVFPYTLELTEYAYKKTGKKVSLHMCGKTYSLWKYFIRYPIGEISLDNIIDLKRAAAELGQHIRIAGNVDPVNVIMNGSERDIKEAVEFCVKAGSESANGFTLATGCDIPDTTEPARIEMFMEAARSIIL